METHQNYWSEIFDRQYALPDAQPTLSKHHQNIYFNFNKVKQQRRILDFQVYKQDFPVLCHEVIFVHCI